MSYRILTLERPVSYTHLDVYKRQAFALAGDERDRTRETWQAGEALYRVASRAAAPERETRYPTLSSLRADWLRACAEEGF